MAGLETATGGDEEVRDSDDLQVDQGILIDVEWNVRPGVHKELDRCEVSGRTARAVQHGVVQVAKVL